MLFYRVEGTDAWQIKSSATNSCTVHNIQQGVNYKFSVSATSNSTTTADSDMSNPGNFILENIGSYDVDGDGIVNVATDINLIVRYFARLRDERLVNGLLTDKSTRNAEEIAAYISDNYSDFDIDQSGSVTVASDINLLQRYFAGLRNDRLISGLLTPESTLIASEISDYISELSVSTVNSPMEGLLIEANCPLSASGKLAAGDSLEVQNSTTAPCKAKNLLPAASQYQMVTSDGNSSACAGDVYNVKVNYTTNPLNNELSTLILQIHYDSSILSFDPDSQTSGWYFTYGIEQDCIPTVYNENDFNYDADSHPETDKYIYCHWNDSTFQWPGTMLPTQLLNLSFSVNEGVSAGALTTIYFNAFETTANWSFEESSHQMRIPVEK